MPNDFHAEYAQRSDDELLHLASARASLTHEAAEALDAELSRRNLTESDRKTYQRFVHRMERREFKGRRRRKLFGKSQFSGRELLSAFLAMALIMAVYFALPRQYHLKPDWEEPVVEVMIVFILVVVGWRSLWRDIAFWMALILSSATQLAVVHSWVRRQGELSRAGGKLAMFLGLALFFGMYGCLRLLRRNFYPEGTQGGTA